MRVVYFEGPEKYETHGQGDILRGVVREMDTFYAMGLIKQGIVVAAESVETEEE